MSCIIAEKALDDAARAIHAEFFGASVENAEGGKGRKAKPSAPKAAGKRRTARA